MTKPIDSIMEKEMTRKEFIAVLGFGVASVLGFSTIIHLLTGKRSPLHHVTMGYGSSVYGGEQKLATKS
jgi:hypothetical protein